MTRLAMAALSCLVLTACSVAAPTTGPSPTPIVAPSDRPTDPPGTTPSPTAPPSPSPSSTSGPQPSATDGGGIPHPNGPDELVLRIGMDGGLAGPDRHARTLPLVSVYGDGRILMEWATDSIFPGPALPPLVVSRVSAAGIQTILEAAAEAGLLGPDRHYELCCVADAGTTSFTVNADGATHVITVYALGMEESVPDQVDPEELEVRRRMGAFLNGFFDLRSWLGADVIADRLPYAFEDLRIFVVPAQPAEELEIEPEVRAWPLEGDLGRFGEPYPMGEGARCGTVSGDDLDTLLPALQASNHLTQWRSEGSLYQLILRPLLPDEAGCPPVALG